MLVPYLSTYGPRLLARFFPDMLWRRSDEARVAYLTFDDGPTRTMTAPLLRLLARYEARATFFLIGAQAKQHPEKVHALAEAGHTLGNHTWTHPDAWRTPAEKVQEELSRTTAFLEDLTQMPIHYMRPPYGRFTNAMRQWCRARSQRLVMWDVMPGDFLPTASARSVERFVRRTLRPGAVVVLHDNPLVEDVTLPALRQLLPVLKEEGWRLKAL